MLEHVKGHGRISCPLTVSYPIPDAKGHVVVYLLDTQRVLYVSRAKEKAIIFMQIKKDKKIEGGNLHIPQRVQNWKKALLC